MSGRFPRAAARVLAVTAWLAVVPIAAQGSDEPDGMRNRITLAWERTHAAIDGVQVTCRMLDPGPSKPDSHFIHVELKVSPPSAFAIDSAHGWHAQRWQDDYRRNRTFIRSASFVVDWPNKRGFEEWTLPPDETPERLGSQFWFRATGYWPKGCAIPVPRYFGNPLGILAVLADEGYGVGVPTETVGDAPCVVVEKPGEDRLCLDPARGFALARRSWWYQGELAMEIEIEAFDRLPGDVFLPRVVVARVRDVGRGEAAMITRRIECATVLGPIAADAFAFAPGPGYLRMERAAGKLSQQAVAGGIEFLQQWGEGFARRYADQHRDVAGRGWWWVAAGAIPAALAFSFWVGGRRHGGRS